ncbi:MAG: hypothetical protein Q8L64_05940 [bacterium]|nr:hypothetical protein [bacterium]
MKKPPSIGWLCCKITLTDQLQEVFLRKGEAEDDILHLGPIDEHRAVTAREHGARIGVSHFLTLGLELELVEQEDRKRTKEENLALPDSRMTAVGANVAHIRTIETRAMLVLIDLITEVPVNDLVLVDDGATVVPRGFDEPKSIAVEFIRIFINDESFAIESYSGFPGNFCPTMN